MLSLVATLIIFGFAMYVPRTFLRVEQAIPVFDFFQTVRSVYVPSCSAGVPGS